jgi:hypothetical protein
LKSEAVASTLPSPSSSWSMMACGMSRPLNPVVIAGSSVKTESRLMPLLV